MNTNGVFLNVALLYGAIWAFWEALVSWIISSCSLNSLRRPHWMSSGELTVIYRSWNTCHRPLVTRICFHISFVQDFWDCITLEHIVCVFLCKSHRGSAHSSTLPPNGAAAFVRVFMSGPVRSHYFPSISKYSSVLTLCQTLSACPYTHRYSSHKHNCFFISLLFFCSWTVKFAAISLEFKTFA